MWLCVLTLGTPELPEQTGEALEASEPAPAPPAGAPWAEGGIGLAMPAAGMGLAPMLQLGGGYALRPRVELGARVHLRAPGQASGTLEDPALAEPLDWESRLRAAYLGANAAWLLPLEPLTLRFGLSLGVATLEQRTEGLAGQTVEARITPWVEPAVSGLYPVGPGAVVVRVAVAIAPAELAVSGNAVGGSAVVVGLGYRWPG